MVGFAHSTGPSDAREGSTNSPRCIRTTYRTMSLVLVGHAYKSGTCTVGEIHRSGTLPIRNDVRGNSSQLLLWYRTFFPGASPFSRPPIRSCAMPITFLDRKHSVHLMLHRTTFLSSFPQAIHIHHFYHAVEGSRFGCPCSTNTPHGSWQHRNCWLSSKGATARGSMPRFPIFRGCICRFRWPLGVYLHRVSTNKTR